MRRWLVCGDNPTKIAGGATCVLVGRTPVGFRLDRLLLTGDLEGLWVNEIRSGQSIVWQGHTEAHQFGPGALGSLRGKVKADSDVSVLIANEAEAIREVAASVVGSGP